MDDLQRDNEAEDDNNNLLNVDMGMLDQLRGIAQQLETEYGDISMRHSPSGCGDTITVLLNDKGQEVGEWQPSECDDEDNLAGAQMSGDWIFVTPPRNTRTLEGSVPVSEIIAKHEEGILTEVCASTLDELVPASGKIRL